MSGRKGPHAPSAEHVFAEEAIEGAGDERLVCYTGRDAMQHIRSDGADLPPSTVERHGEEAFILHPEGVIEPRLERDGFS